MTKLSKDQNAARPAPGRVFLFRRGDVAMPNLAAQLIFWPVVVFGVVLDLWTKKAVFDWLQQPRGPGSFSVIDDFLQLVIAVNDGAAFGIASGQRYKLVALSVIALIVILVIFLFSGTERKLVHVALGLFTAGVCGNLYDRMFNNGLVRDFLDVVYWPGKHWPAFNVADSMLCIGVALIIISGFFTEKSAQKHARQHE